MKEIQVAVIGLGFGGEFVPIYKSMAGADCAAVCRRSEAELHQFADAFGVAKRYARYEDVLADPEIDAVHINSPMSEHGAMSIAALRAGKHCACTVPMAMTPEECAEIEALEAETGKVYMMMETAVYTREYLYIKSLYESGELGRIQFMRGSHQQNMSMPGWPDYWYGFPPMHYSTHALAPLADLLDKPIAEVRCVGSGRIEEEYVGCYGSPFAIESAHLLFADSDVCGEVTRSLFRTIRQYRESFDVYASQLSVEWEQVAGEKPVLFSGFEDARHVDVPDTDVLLPPEIRKYARREGAVDPAQLSFIQGSDHGGSHPHLVHEFISAIREGRKSHIHAAKAANWTIAGLAAHQSAMEGRPVSIWGGNMEKAH